MKSRRHSPNRRMAGIGLWPQPRPTCPELILHLAGEPILVVMSAMPARRETQNLTRGPTFVVGLFLARLYAYLVRLHRSGAATVPRDMASMVASAEIMVHGVVCCLAERRLRAAGYQREAEVLRGQGIRPVHAPASEASPADLITRLEASLTLFEQREANSERLALLVVCFYSILYSDTPKTASSVIIMSDYARITAYNGGPKPHGRRQYANPLPHTASSHPHNPRGRDPSAAIIAQVAIRRAASFRSQLD